MLPLDGCQGEDEGRMLRLESIFVLTNLSR